MATSGPESLASLQLLLAACRDGREGYRAAARTVRSIELKRVLARLSDERGENIRELEQEIEKLGARGITHGTLAGTLHRAWIGLSRVLRGGSDEVLLREVDRGESSTLLHYEEELARESSEPMRPLIERQMMRVDAARSEVRRWVERVAQPS